jgi:hypothetical protein
MTCEISDVKQTEALYEFLAKAVDDVREGRSEEMARECEAQFLIKLSFLALRELGNPDKQRELIVIAARDLG